jgi:hypothetical protein
MIRILEPWKPWKTNKITLPTIGYEWLRSIVKEPIIIIAHAMVDAVARQIRSPSEEGTILPEKEIVESRLQPKITKIADILLVYKWLADQETSLATKTFD